MKKPSRKVIGALLTALVVFCAPVGARALCENISNKTLLLGTQRWRTLTGGDQAYANSFYDTGSSEPALPQFQEIGWLPPGGLWLASFFGSIQDSSDSECDDVTEGFEMDFYTSNNTCAQPAFSSFQAVFHANTCNNGANKFYAQRTTTMSVVIDYAPSYRIQNFIFTGSTLRASEPNGCVRVSTVESGCN